MDVLLLIISEIIAPVFVLIFVGVLLQRKFQMDLSTLSKVNFYYLIPAVIFLRIYESSLSFELIGNVLLFLFIQAAGLWLASYAGSKIFGYQRDYRVTLQNSILLNNQGNFGLPVNALVFRNDPFAASIQIIIMTFQNILTFTYGVFSMGASQQGAKKAAASFVKMPVLHALLLGLLFSWAGITLPAAIAIPLDSAAAGFLAVALMSLGAQVAYLKLNKNLGIVAFSSFLRLLFSPMLALAVIWLLDLSGMMAQALLISSAFPTSRNSAAIALEYDNNPDLAAQMVLVSTILSSITVTAVVYIAFILF
ncbi:AEC family transporter [Thalassorhabdus alkalitolerans]|uniref:AEC family transporter n=1 Tax=Thalassorhabdus alkalitolerans TaxID=2282697 RepID=A0ABW0YM24_9BACI